MAKLKVEGAEQLQKKLDSLAKKDANAALRKGLRAGGKITAKVLKGNMPNKSGKAKRKVKVRAGKRSRKKGPSVTVGVAAKDFTGEAFYIGFVNFGWKTGKRGNENSGAVPIGGGKFVTRIGGKRKRKQVRGKNFIKEAADQSQPAASAEVARVTGAEIEKRLRG